MLFSRRVKNNLLNTLIMPSPQSLQKQLLSYYLNLIREKKIKFTDIEYKLPHMLKNKILNLLIEDGRCYYLNNQYQDLKAELMIATAQSVEVNEDMALVHDIDGVDRELVRDVYIKFKEPRQMFAILDTDEYEEEDDINIMSDSREDLLQYEMTISEIFVDFYKGINEYRHPCWDKIFKFAEKKCFWYDHTNLSSLDEHEYY